MREGSSGIEPSGKIMTYQPIYKYCIWCGKDKPKNTAQYCSKKCIKEVNGSLPEMKEYKGYKFIKKYRQWDCDVLGGSFYTMNEAKKYIDGLKARKKI